MDIIDDYKQIRMIEIVKQLQQLKTENEKLKEENNYLEKRVKAEIHLGNNYKKDFADIVNEHTKLKQCLEEIKEICLKSTNEKFNMNDLLNASDLELTERGQTHRDILKIISEVINER